jgi:hypothetical protein
MNIHKTIRSPYVSQPILVRLERFIGCHLYSTLYMAEKICVNSKLENYSGLLSPPIDELGTDEDDDNVPKVLTDIAAYSLCIVAKNNLGCNYRYGRRACYRGATEPVWQETHLLTVKTYEPQQQHPPHYYRHIRTILPHKPRPRQTHITATEDVHMTVVGPNQCGKKHTSKRLRLTSLNSNTLLSTTVTSEQSCRTSPGRDRPIWLRF